MKHHKDIRQIHEEIQKKLFLMLPEKWDSLYLYASVIERFNEFETGEMFFYYFPKGILKKRPVNVYEVPHKFNIDETHYFRLANDLYNSIKKLRDICKKNKQKPWTNLTIVIEKLKYKVIYGYDDLTSGELTVEERRIAWTYKYLNEPYASFNKKEREIIDKYQKISNQDEVVFEMSIYEKSINKHIENIKDLERKFEFVTEERIQEMEFKKNHVPKSQILSLK